MHVKNADLHRSYAIPVRVSDALSAVVVVAARDKTNKFGVPVDDWAARFTTFAPVRDVAELDVWVVRFDVVRATGNTDVRATVVRSDDGWVVEIRFCDVARCAELPSRTAAPACATDIAIAITKIRIFFISDEIVSKIAKSGQEKYKQIYEFYLIRWVIFSDFLVAKIFMLRYYVERFTIVGHMAAYESARQT